MTFWDGIRRWAGSPAVHRHAPVAGSVAVHCVAALIVIGALAAVAEQSGGTVRVEQRREKVIEIALLSDALPLPASPRPRTPGPATSSPAPTDAAPPLGKAGAKGQPQTSAPAAPEDPGEDGVSFGDLPVGLAHGLAGLTGDPCKATYGPKPRACGTDWAAKSGNQPSAMPPPKEEQAKFYAEYMPKCPWNVGCEGGEWVSTNGTRSVGRAAPGARNDRGSSTPMAAGAAGLGGLHDSVGRLGFNPDHFDRGFGD